MSRPSLVTRFEDSIVAVDAKGWFTLKAEDGHPRSVRQFCEILLQAVRDFQSSFFTASAFVAWARGCLSVERHERRRDELQSAILLLAMAFAEVEMPLLPEPECQSVERFKKDALRRVPTTRNTPAGWIAECIHTYVCDLWREE